MSRKLGSYGAAGGFFLMLVLFTGVIAFDTTRKYFTGTLAAPEPILANAFADPFLVLHAAGGVTAILVALLQFAPSIRNRWPAVHRGTGRIYVAACIVGAPTGLVLAFGTTAGPVAGVGFGLLAILWALFTFLGVRAALRGRVAQHRAWMIRSYAMAGAAITLRLLIPTSMVLGLPFLPAYQAIAWLSWMSNLMLGEIYLRRNQAVTLVPTRVATA